MLLRSVLGLIVSLIAIVGLTLQPKRIGMSSLSTEEASLVSYLQSPPNAGPAFSRAHKQAC